MTITEYVKNQFHNMHAMNHMAPKRNRERERSRSTEKYEIFCKKKVFNKFFHECLGVRSKLVGISVSLCFTRNQSLNSFLKQLFISGA